MMKEIEASELLLKQLLDNGYPLESLESDWEKDGKGGIHYNLSIIDPKTRELIAIIELKIQSELISSSNGIRTSIERFLKIGKKDISFFLVTLKKGELIIDQFIPNITNSKKGELIPINKMPKFEDLRKKTLGEKRKNTQRLIEIITWMSAVSKIKIFNIEFERHTDKD